MRHFQGEISESLSLDIWHYKFPEAVPETPPRGALGQQLVAMSYRQPYEHRPIQTSAVIVLGAHKSPANPPPSPPTPSVSPDDGPLCEPPDPFTLGEQQGSRQAEAKARRLSRALHVLSTEAAALENLSQLYETDGVAQDGFNRAVEAITRQSAANGKLVVIGVGKSGHIGKKFVATLQSLAIRSVFLHPTEALHGDLGIVGPQDTLLFITYSGKTQELLLLLPHLDESLPTIVLTSHTQPETCEFMRHRPNAILLPAPIPEAEKVTFGVSAPSTSTTVALALADSLAITVANELHQNVPAEFARNHPGGAIGAATRVPQTLKHLAVSWEEISGSADLTLDSLGVDLLRAGFDSKTGWVRVQNGVATPSGIRQLSSAELGQPLRDLPGVVLERRGMIAMSSDTPIRQAGEMLRAMQPQDADAADEEGSCGSRSVIAVTESGSIVGVLEAQCILDYQAA